MPDIMELRAVAFVPHKEDYGLEDFEGLRDHLQSVIGLLKRYQKAIVGGASLALLRSGDPDEFHGKVLNEMISVKLGGTGPRLIDPEGDLESLNTFSPSWIHALMAIQADEVEGGEDGSYRCWIRGQLAEWNEKENRILLYFAREQLPHGEDIKKEMEMRLGTLAYLNQVASELVEGG